MKGYSLGAVLVTAVVFFGIGWYAGHNTWCLPGTVNCVLFK